MMCQGVEEEKKKSSSRHNVSVKKMKTLQHNKTLSLEGRELCIYFYFVIFCATPAKSEGWVYFKGIVHSTLVDVFMLV